jgi:glutaredoxin
MFAFAYFMPRSILRRASSSRPRTPTGLPSAMLASVCALAVLVGLFPAAMARCNAYDEVYLFERPGCLPCMAAKRLLAQHGIRYESRDARVPENAWYMQTYAGTEGTPVITIGNRTDGYRHVLGYHEPLLKLYLCLY